MNTLKKILSVAAILTIALAFSSLLLQTHSEELSTKDKSLAFITDVVGLDMTKYNVTHTGEDTLIPRGTTGIVNDVTNHILEYKGSKLAIMCTYQKEVLVGYDLTVLNGSILTAQPPAGNSLSSAKTYFQKYAAYSQQASYLQSMNNMLNSLPNLQNMIQISGNIKLSVSITGTYVKMKFMDSFDNIDNPWKAVVFNINNGILVGLGDGWNTYQMGSTNVAVSSNDAVNIAMNRAENYSLQFYDGPNGTLISVPFSINASSTETQLSIQPRDGTTLYPFWHVQLYFDKWVHTTYGLEAGIWADNGQVVFFQPTGIAGTSDDSGEPTPQPTVQPTPIATTPTPLSEQPTPVATTPVDSPNPTLEPTATPQPVSSQRVNPIPNNTTVSPSPQLGTNGSWLSIVLAISTTALIAIVLITAVVVKKRSK